MGRKPGKRKSKPVKYILFLQREGGEGMKPKRV
jgi:hypothetical protein